MKKNKAIVYLAAIIMVAMGGFYLSACKKPTPSDGIKEPITFMIPDTNWIEKRMTDSIPIKVQFTTDRPIDSIAIYGNLDTLHYGFEPTVDPKFLIVSKAFYPDTNNIQVYEKTLTIPAVGSFGQGDVERLLFTMYARGNLTYSKIMRVDIK
jgi:hypothetical protein